MNDCQDLDYPLTDSIRQDEWSPRHRQFAGGRHAPETSGGGMAPKYARNLFDSIDQTLRSGSVIGSHIIVGAVEVGDRQPTPA